MAREQCECGNTGVAPFLCKCHGLCHGCCPNIAEFDADELGLDPETDNTPNHQERTA